MLFWTSAKCLALLTLPIYNRMRVRLPTCCQSLANPRARILGGLAYGLVDRCFFSKRSRPSRSRLCFKHHHSCAHSFSELDLPSFLPGVCGIGDAAGFPTRCWFNNDPQGRYVCCDAQGCDGFNADNLTPHCTNFGYVPPNDGISGGPSPPNPPPDDGQGKLWLPQLKYWQLLSVMWAVELSRDCSVESSKS